MTMGDILFSNILQRWVKVSMRNVASRTAEAAAVVVGARYILKKAMNKV